MGLGAGVGELRFLCLSPAQPRGGGGGGGGQRGDQLTGDGRRHTDRQTHNRSRHAEPIYSSEKMWLYNESSSQGECVVFCSVNRQSGFESSFDPKLEVKNYILLPYSAC